MKIDPELMEEAARVQKQIWIHEEMYAEEQWDEFQMRHGLSDEELEEYKTKNKA
jgi:hypothetical protein